MNNVTIKDMYMYIKKKNIQGSSDKLLGLSVDNSVDDAVAISRFYQIAYKDIDRKMFKLYQDFSPLANVDEVLEEREYLYDDTTEHTDEEIIKFVHDSFVEDLQSFLNTRASAYKHLFEVLSIDYNPINNYDMTESSTDNKTNNASDKHQYGESSSTVNYGERNEAIERGGLVVTKENAKRSTTDSYGAMSKTNEFGDTNENVTNAVAGYNEDAFKNSTKTQTTNASHVDSETNEAHSDTHETAAFTDITSTNDHVDNNVYSQHVDTSTVAAHEDNDTHSGTESNEHSMTRSGNVGVTSTQQLLESEKKFWRSYDFWKMFLKDFIAEHCTFHDDGYSVTETPLRNVLFDM